MLIFRSLLLSFMSLIFAQSTSWANPKITLGAYGDIGTYRKTMEDFHVTKNDGELTYIGVYDGHGGSKTSKMLSEDLINAVLSRVLNPANKASAAIKLSASYDELDKKILDKQWDDGSTSVDIIIQGKTLYSANAGDSEAILVSRSKDVDQGGLSHLELTACHNAAKNKSEIARVKAAGGTVFFGRVNGSLAVTRSFGDSAYKRPKTGDADHVIVAPFTKELTLTADDLYIISATDGLWDVVQKDEAAIFVDKEFRSGKDANAIARALVARAIEKKSKDNITVVIAKLDWSDAPLTAPAIDPAALDAQKKILHVRGMELAAPAKPAQNILFADVSTLETLPMSLFWLTPDVLSAYCTYHNVEDPRDGKGRWVSQEHISKEFFGENGVAYLKKVEAARNGFVLFANCFSNVHEKFRYDEKSFFVDGVQFAHNETFFQIGKVTDPAEFQEKLAVMNKLTPLEATIEGRTVKSYRHLEWEAGKEERMYKGLKAKFAIDVEARETLLSTGEHDLAQLKPFDNDWGTGEEGKGKNLLGELLKKLRKELRQEKKTDVPNPDEMTHPDDDASHPAEGMLMETN